MLSRREVLSCTGASLAAGLLVGPQVLSAQAAAGGPRAPKALVYEVADRWSSAAGADEMLRAAGFEVEKLPLDRDPATLEADLIFLGSFSSESPELRAYCADRAAALAAFVERGRVLVQMAQADQTEASPAFLPGKLVAKRADPDFAEAAIVSEKHPLVKGVRADGGTIRFGRKDRRTIWEAIVEQDGFEVIMAADRDGGPIGLMEAAHGKGRIVLAAMDLDKAKDATTGEAYGTDAQRSFAAAFFRNLAAHVVAVRDGTAPPLTPTPKAMPTEAFVPGSWTLAVLPDTQVYSLRYPGLLTLQARWLIENRKRYDVRYALQLGDVTNNNTPREWERARDALGQLYGQVPLAIATGNHDYGPNGNSTTRQTGFRAAFPVEQARSQQPTLGGVMDEGSLENSYHLFSAGGVDWIVIALEWAPRDETVAWANEVMAKHGAQRRGILITHAYLFSNGLRYDINDKVNPQTWNPHLYKTPGSKNDGEQLWQKLVRKHDFAIVHNGHVLNDGTGYLASKNDKGRTCHQILANYQFRQLGGEGYMRLMEFRPDGKTVKVKTYSPLYDKYLTAADQQFAFELD